MNSYSKEGLFVRFVGKAMRKWNGREQEKASDLLSHLSLLVYWIVGLLLFKADFSHFFTCVRQNLNLLSVVDVTVMDL